MMIVISASMQVLKKIGEPLVEADLKLALQKQCGISSQWIREVLVGSPSLRKFLLSLDGVRCTDKQWHLASMQVSSSRNNAYNDRVDDIEQY
jgi:hypothetical protein